MNCTNVAFDTDCLAEYFMLNPNGGAFAVTGSSGRPSRALPGCTWTSTTGCSSWTTSFSSGRLQAKSREPFTTRAYGETADRWTHFIYNYLGDPEVEHVPGQPGILRCHRSGIGCSTGITRSIDRGDSGGVTLDSALCLPLQGRRRLPVRIHRRGGTGHLRRFPVQGSGGRSVTVTGVDHCQGYDLDHVDPETGDYLRVNRDDRTTVPAATVTAPLIPERPCRSGSSCSARGRREFGALGRDSTSDPRGD